MRENRVVLSGLKNEDRTDRTSVPGIKRGEKRRDEYGHQLVRKGTKIYLEKTTFEMRE